jgi:hypothetical protein
MLTEKTQEFAAKAGGADALRIGTAHDWDHLHAGDFRRAVPSFAFGRRPVNFDELGEVATIRERRGDGGFVRHKAIGGDLEFSTGSVRRLSMNTSVVA